MQIVINQRRGKEKQKKKKKKQITRRGDVAPLCVPLCIGWEFVSFAWFRLACISSAPFTLFDLPFLSSLPSSYNNRDNFFFVFFPRHGKEVFFAFVNFRIYSFVAHVLRS